MNRLKHQLARRLVPEQQLLVQLLRNIVDTFESAMNLLRHGLAHLGNESFHIHLLQGTADNDM